MFLSLKTQSKHSPSTNTVVDHSDIDCILLPAVWKSENTFEKFSRIMWSNYCYDSVHLPGYLFINDFINSLCLLNRPLVLPMIRVLFICIYIFAIFVLGFQALTAKADKDFSDPISTYLYFE